MIREITRTYVVCDNCGYRCPDDINQPNTIEQVVEEAEEDGWQFPPDRDKPDWCPQCVRELGGKPTRKQRMADNA